MSLQTFDYNGKTYNIIKPLSLPQDIKIKKILVDINSMKQLENKPAKELMDMVDDITMRISKHQEYISETLEKNLGITFDEQENIPLEDALGIFGKFYSESSTLKKKSPVQLESPSNLDTPPQTI